MIHLIVDKLNPTTPIGLGRITRVSACGSYEGGTSAHRKNVTCTACRAANPEGEAFIKAAEAQARRRAARCNQEAK